MKQTTRARTEYSAFPTGRMAALNRTNSTPAHDTQTTSHTHILVHRAQNKDASTTTGIHSQSFSDRRMRLLHEFRINEEVARRPIGPPSHFTRKGGFFRLLRATLRASKTTDLAARCIHRATSLPPSRIAFSIILQLSPYSVISKALRPDNAANDASLRPGEDSSDP